jgi:putative DNA primase/helicase
MVTLRKEPELNEDNCRPPAFSEDALALEFTEAHADDLRYVAAWRRWFYWNGERWVMDETMHAFDLARRICRKAAAAVNEKGKALASAKVVAAVERLAQSDRQMAATIDQWDADPWILNTPGGVVDLRTGRLRQASPTDYCTKITAVAPATMDNPTWLAFLQRVTGGDKALVDYLQRALGYSLTGLVTENALLFLHGTGSNGKSVFLNTVAGILHDYHTTAPIETFTASNSDRHPTELADLRGARLVTSVETEEGRRWAESKIKTLTGGDPIKARFMRRDFFEYDPQFKLWIAGNHKPGLRSVDEAIRRRLHLVPFTVTIPKAERDPELTEKLKAEWPGVLAWMIEGCLRWQEAGLAPPAAVVAATTEYLANEDTLAAWLEECCELDPNAFASRTTLFASWKAWTERSREHTGSATRFYERLETRDGVRASQKREGSAPVRGFFGLVIRGSLVPSYEKRDATTCDEMWGC